MLIKPTQIKEPESQDSNVLQGYVTAGANKFSLGTVGRVLKKAVGTIEKGKSVHIPTKGNWSSHNLLSYLLKQTGPAKVWITTWSISEVSMRTLIRLMDQGMVTKAHLLIDERAKAMFPEAYQVASHNVADFKMCKIHAKCIIIQNEQWSISVITTANFNANRHIELYVICEDEYIANRHLGWIQDEMNGGRPFEMQEDERVQ